MSDEQWMRQSRAGGAPSRRGILHRTPGSRVEAFGPLEWSLLAGISLMWGSSFLFIAIGVESFEPGVVAFARLALGAATLAFVPRARRSNRGRARRRERS